MLFVFLMCTSLVLCSDFHFYNIAVAASPSFGLQELINENRNWVQTYGNSSLNLKSNYTDMLAVDYISDGKFLNATIWLASGFSKYAASALNATNSNLPSKKLSYGMLIDADSNPKTGYNGADYDLYVESTGGKLSGYLYELSSTGGYRLLGSEINFTKTFNETKDVGPGYIHLSLNLGSINSPSKYDVLFYSAESLHSNEVRQFTNWVNIPPPNLQINTSPNNLSIRQGEEQLIPARIKSTSGFSNDVVNITIGDAKSGNDNTGKNINYNTVTGYNSSELPVNVERTQPPLFKITVPPQTPLGIYTIPLIITIREPSIATITKPINITANGGTINPKFELSKKYPTVGYLTKPINFTVTVIPSKSTAEQFRDFWTTYGQFIGIFAGAFVGAFAKLVFDRVKEKKESKQ